MQRTVDVVGARTLMPNSALATLVALTPDDAGVEYVYCDENLEELDSGMSCDLVGITGFTLHARRIGEISAIFRARGIPVALGGTFATLTPEEAAPLADHLFVGEAELTWPAFLRDWAAGEARPVYRQESHIDMKLSPPPDWSMVRGKDYLYFTVQTSRGCPHNCDFCNSVRLVGRKYRHKTVSQTMTEIRNAHAMGAETVFFSEDNFFVNKVFTRELLAEITRWNTSQERPISFSCQATVALGADEETVKAMSDARFSAVFLGVESLRKECLDEVNKGRLARYDVMQTVTTLNRYAILPFIGLIVGFDNDDESTFEEMERFLTDTGSPLASISVLNAPEGTRLYERMAQQGRIDEGFAGVWHFSTNIVPEAMSLEELLSRHRDLFTRLYQPSTFARRAWQWLDQVEYLTPLYSGSKRDWSKMRRAVRIFRYFLFHRSGEMRRMFFKVLRKGWKKNPRLVKKVFTVMSQFPHYYEFCNRASWHESVSE